MRLMTLNAVVAFVSWEDWRWWCNGGLSFTQGRVERGKELHLPRLATNAMNGFLGFQKLPGSSIDFRDLSRTRCDTASTGREDRRGCARAAIRKDDPCSIGHHSTIYDSMEACILHLISSPSSSIKKAILLVVGRL